MCCVVLCLLLAVFICSLLFLLSHLSPSTRYHFLILSHLYLWIYFSVPFLFFWDQPDLHSGTRCVSEPSAIKKLVHIACYLQKLSFDIITILWHSAILLYFSCVTTPLPLFLDYDIIRWAMMIINDRSNSRLIYSRYLHFRILCFSSILVLFSFFFFFCMLMEL